MSPQRHSLSRPQLAQHRGRHHAGMDRPEVREGQLKGHSRPLRNRRKRGCSDGFLGKLWVGSPVGMGVFPGFFFFPLKVLFIFIERGREDEREGEKHPQQGP